MANPETSVQDIEIAFRDRKGREQRGTLVEILGEEDRGIETAQDAFAVAWLALVQSFPKQEK